MMERRRSIRDRFEGVGRVDVGSKLITNDEKVRGGMTW